MSVIERIWFGDDAFASVARAALSPLAMAYGAAASTRDWMFARGTLTSYETAIPAVSVGNATVGGTGKTPIAAWLAGRLLEKGAIPAIVMRGYGDDEPLVHRALNPDVPVIVDADRVQGVAAAKAYGCDIAVLDDAMQHRRARRIADLVLVGADRWEPKARVLPAGPWRERPSALARASLVLVTRKAASADDAARVSDWVRTIAPKVPRAVAELAADALRRTGGEETRSLATLRGQRVLAVAGIGDPHAFARQLQSLGARVELRAYADHHAFDAADVQDLLRAATDVDTIICTLKDAVKLGPLWPRAGRALWYVSQRVRIEAGAPELEQLIAHVMERARASRADNLPADRRRTPANTSSHAH